MNHTTSTTTAILALLLSTPACSTVTTASAPHIGTPAASDPSSLCRVTGEPVVLARRPFAPAGVETLARDGAFEVRFAARKASCFAVDWPAATEDRQAPCPISGADVTAARDTDTTVAWQPMVARAPSVLGVAMAVRSREPREGDEGLAGRPVRAPLASRGAPRGGGEATALLVPIGGDRFLSVSIEGGLESHRLRAQAITSSGEAAGRAFDLSPPDASVIGRASAAIEPDGEGLVAYIASTGAEFDVLATPISCAAR